MVSSTDSHAHNRQSIGEEMISVNNGRSRDTHKLSRSSTGSTASRGEEMNRKSSLFSDGSNESELLVNMIPNNGRDIELQVRPSTLEVDYDKNITTLYQTITNSNWKAAVKAAKDKPEDARTWVVRHYQEEDGTTNDQKEPEIMWRFLPIHSASARQPPEEVIGALLHAYPDGARCVDDQGMFALHYACGNQASCEVIRMLLGSFPEASHMHDPNGMLPLHYLACWGPSSMPVVDMILVANRDAVNAKDAEGNTPLDLALDGEYPDRDRVVTVLRQWASNVTESRSVNGGGGGSTSSVSSIRFNTKPTTISLVDHEEEEDEEMDRFLNRDEKSEASRRMESNRGDPSSPESSLKISTKKQPQSILRSTSTPRERGMEREIDRGVPKDREREGGSSPSTPFLVSRLKDEISTLKDKLKESKWELQAQKSMENQASLKERISQLERKSDRQVEELEITREELDEVQLELEKKEEECLKLRKELKEKDSKLKEALSERKGLRITLTDLMEQHEKFKRKADHMNDRLGSLSASLASMIDQHKTVLHAMQQREEAWRKSTNERKAKLAELVSMETEMEQDSSLEEALDKQNKEMEAIAAVIAVTRQ